MVVPLSDEQRAVHIPRLVDELALRLSKSSAAMIDCDAIFSAAAVAHGELRYLQGYTPAMLVDESRILEITIFGKQTPISKTTRRSRVCLFCNDRRTGRNPMNLYPPASSRN